MTHPNAQSGETGPSAGARSRSADLQLWHVDPWSVLRYASVLSIFGFIVWMITAFLLYTALSAIGLVDSLRDLADSLFKDDARDAVYGYLTLGSAMALAAIIGAVGALLSIVLATLMSFVHNITSRITGGITVSLRSRQ